VELLAERTGIVEMVLSNFVAPPEAQIAGLGRTISDSAIDLLERMTEIPPGWFSVERPQDDGSRRWKRYFAERANRHDGVEARLASLHIPTVISDSLRGWGANVSVQADDLLGNHGFRLQWAAMERPEHRDTGVTLLMRIESDRIGPGEMVITSLGIGADTVEAASIALSKLGETPLSMLVRALTGQGMASSLERPERRVETAAGAWTLFHHLWASPEPASLVVPLDTLAAELAAEALQDARAGESRWLQTGLALHEGRPRRTSVLQRGIAWPVGHRKLLERAWPSEPTYSAAKHFILALPARDEHITAQTIISSVDGE